METLVIILAGVVLGILVIMEAESIMDIIYTMGKIKKLKEDIYEEERA